MLSSHVARYVALHRRLGLRFDEQKRMLELYASWAEAHGDQFALTNRSTTGALPHPPRIERRPGLRRSGDFASSSMLRTPVTRRRLRMHSAEVNVRGRHRTFWSPIRFGRSCAPRSICRPRA